MYFGGSLDGKNQCNFLEPQYWFCLFKHLMFVLTCSGSTTQALFLVSTCSIRTVFWSILISEAERMEKKSISGIKRILKQVSVGCYLFVCLFQVMFIMKWFSKDRRVKRSCRDPKESTDVECIQSVFSCYLKFQSALSEPSSQHYLFLPCLYHLFAECSAQI